MAFSCRNLVVAGLLMVVGSESLAQPRDDRSESRLNVRRTFCTFALEPIVSLHYRPRPGAALEPIRFYSSARSADYQYDGPPRLEFFADAEPGAAVAAIDLETVTTPRVLLIFHPRRPTGGVGYEITALPHDLERLPPRSAVVVNLSGRRFRASLNQHTIELPMGGATAPVPIRERTSLQLSVPTEEGWRRVTAVDLEFVERARAWIVLFPPYRRGELQPQLRVLHESEAPAREPPKTTRREK